MKFVTPAALIADNNVRIKSNWQLANEAQALIGIASERAKERQLTGKLIDLSEPVPQGSSNGRATDEVGEQLGISGRTVSDMLTVKEVVSELGYFTWEDFCTKKLQTEAENIEAEVVLRANGGDRRSEQFQYDNCNTEKLIHQGNSADYTTARLRRDNPLLAEKVERGELSAHAAAIEAGWRKKQNRYSLPDDPCAALPFNVPNFRKWTPSRNLGQRDILLTM